MRQRLSTSIWMNSTLEIEIQQHVGARLKRFAPDAPLIVVPVYNAIDDVLECVHNLLETSPADTPLLVLDDASPDGRMAQALEPLTHHAESYLCATAGQRRFLTYG